MDVLTTLILLITGIAIGVINNLAGAAGVLGLIALEEVVGLGSAEANRTLRPCALGIGLGGMSGFHSRGRRVPPRAWLYGLAAMPGAVAGTMAAMELPVVVYRLVLAGVVLVLSIQQLRPGASEPVPAVKRTPAWVAVSLFFLTGVHMGFVQVGTGLVAIAALTAVMSRDLVRVNTVKMAIVVVSSATSTAILAATDHIDWPPALPLALGAFIGSFFAGRWSVRHGHRPIRLVVLAISFAVLLRIGWQVATGAL